MNESVLDASVVLKWFRSEGERHLAPARSLRHAFETGALQVFSPPLLHLEIVNVAGRRWRWDERALVELVDALGDLGFVLIEPDLKRVAFWTAKGLTSYDAAYVALAEGEGLELITDDELVVARAPRIAVGLATL